jgi:hypothetical protein
MFFQPVMLRRIRLKTAQNEVDLTTIKCHGYPRLLTTSCIIEQAWVMHFMDGI